jgi:hypothetical protein
MLKKVEHTSCQNLGSVIRTGWLEATVARSAIEWQEAKVMPHAQLSTSDKLEGTTRMYTAKLTFKAPSCDADQLREAIATGEHHAWRLTTTDGRVMLMGSTERPFPVMTVGEALPSKVADAQWSDVTVEWQSASPIPYLQEI